MKNIQMVDLVTQYKRLQSEIDPEIKKVLETAYYVGGPKVTEFKESLEKYMDANVVIPCANGTDALQIAFQALGLKPGDEVIVPAFTYVATAEVIALLGLEPKMVDVDPDTYMMNVDHFKEAITDKTKAVVPVHLFGQSADMEDILLLAKEKGIYVVEDNAQAIGAEYTFRDGTVKKVGTLGDVGTTSFFPAKNLGCFGDGGAIFTNNEALGAKIKMIANHGQSRQYYHDEIGVNSRLDALQAAVLNVKLRHLDDFAARRNAVADKYDAAFADLDMVQTPVRTHNSNHVFHQYTLRLKNGKRDALKQYLNDKGIPCNIYYPVPLYEQKAYADISGVKGVLPVTDMLCKEVFSLPIHTEMKAEVQDYIIDGVKAFINDMIKNNH